ncbi:hypothetical protein QWM81_22845 [Streptomyces ficellus]|uniref:DUF1328 domain-containing protein n=1 Tax=Streptomyces ficellus TaxID=1977088 RepID=A0ABT7ZC37_9ACTN|nr:hypothetical protein [Streptomyces ficellus]MDN3296832.1 hypothetical protein [Streptomyces ficellus]
MTVFLALVLLAVILGLIGAVVKGLGYLLAIGIVVFVLALALLFTRSRRR